MSVNKHQDPTAEEDDQPCDQQVGGVSFGYVTSEARCQA